jgi:peptidoglycan/LPS O-acetylase OafA/YrhL
VDQPAEAKTRRFEFLDAARAIAVVLVLFQHNGFPGTTISGFPIDTVINLGRVGVILFFCISGFIIPFSIEKTKSVKSFLVSRFFRLYPAYWISLLLFVAFYNLGVQVDLFQANTSPLQWVANATMLQLYVGVPNVIAVAWTLSIEWCIYIGACIVIVMGERFNPRKATWVASFAIGVLAIATPLIIHKRFPGALPQGLLSALLGYAFLQLYKDRLRASEVALFAIVNTALQAGSAYVNFKLYAKSNQEMGVEAMLVSVVVGELLFAVFYLFRTRSFPKWLTWIGMVSYSMYLFHGLVPLPYIGGLHPLASRSIQFCGIFIISAIGFRFVEQPFHKIGTRFRREMDARADKANRGSLDA